MQNHNQQPALPSMGPITSAIKKPEPCPQCQGTGWVPFTRPDGYSAVRECECARLRRLRARIATILQDWKEYAGASFDAFKPINLGQQAIADIMRANITGSYYISGQYKRGKTFLLICQYRQLALAGQKCILRCARDLVDELRRSEVPATKDADVVPSPVLQMVNLADAGHLFIDDIEKVANTDFRMAMLWNILDTIKRRQLSLTVSSNLPMIGTAGKDLKSKLGSEINCRQVFEFALKIFFVR